MLFSSSLWIPKLLSYPERPRFTLAHSCLKGFFNFFGLITPIMSYFIRVNKFVNCQWIYDLVIVSHMPYGIIPQLGPKNLFHKILHNMGSTNCFDEKNIQTKFLRDLGHNSRKKWLMRKIKEDEEKKYLMVGDYMLDKVLVKIKEIIGIKKFDDTKILIDKDDITR